ALDQDVEDLISHELAHQWFGDMLTCKSWAHLWLNEGFATYMEAAWLENEKGREDYDYEIWNTMRVVADTDKADARGGLVYQQYVYRGGAPSIDVSYEWDDDARAAKIQFAQTQKITSQLPAFDLEIPVWVVAPDGKMTKAPAHVNERSGSLSVKCDKEPAQVV